MTGCCICLLISRTATILLLSVNNPFARSFPGHLRRTWLGSRGKTCCTSQSTKNHLSFIIFLESAIESRSQVLGALAIFWAFANALIKLSILFFYRRVFVGRVFNICSWTLIGLSIFWLVYDTVCWLLYCGTDLHANFEGPWDECPLWAFQIQIPVFALDSFVDLCVIILPVPFVSASSMASG